MSRKSTIDLDALRNQFPALRRKYRGKSLIFLDGPGGTQVPESVIRSISNYYRRSNSNVHGAFVTSGETEKVMTVMREKLSVLLGAKGPETISIGQNMTSLAYSLARGFSRIFNPGDEVLITQLDHEGNREPWLTLQNSGVKVREVELEPNGTLNYKDLEEKINENTRLVAIGLASNALGTVNDIALVRQLCYRYNSWLLLDAVHFAPHFSLDVQELGCDFLLCSAYKFYGPHVGILYSRMGLLDQIPTERLRTTRQVAPFSIETGTLNHAALAGVSAAVDFLSTLGVGDSLRSKLMSAFSQISTHERTLANILYNGLKKVPGLIIIGQDMSPSLRTPTISFTLKGKTPWEVCEQLAQQNICAWNGHFYAIRTIEALGLQEIGGVTRLGISVYNTREEMDFTIKSLKNIAK